MRKSGTRPSHNVGLGPQVTHTFFVRALDATRTSAPLQIHLEIVESRFRSKNPIDFPSNDIHCLYEPCTVQLRYQLN